MCQVDVVFYVETAPRRKAYRLDILPASSLIGRVPTVNWVTHRMQTSRGPPFRTAAQRRRVSVKVKRSLTYDVDIAYIKIPKSAVTSELHENGVRTWQSEWDASNKGELTNN